MPETTTEEKPVSTPKGSDAFTAARASIASAQATDDTPVDDKPTEETATVAGPSTETTADTNDVPDIPEEEVKKLSLKEQKVYRQLQKKFTETSQARAALQKQFDPWKPLIDGMTTDPDKTLEQLAKERGFTVARIVQDTKTIDTHTEQALAELPDELQFLKPILDSYGKKIIDTVRGEIAPIRDATDHIVSEAAQAETEGTLQAFTGKYKDWKQHEPQMLEWMNKFVPQKGAMTDFEYMEHAYKAVTQPITNAEQTKAVIDKINKSAAAAEPSTSGTNAQRVEHTMPPEGQRDIRAAWEAAKRGERWTK